MRKQIVGLVGAISIASAALVAAAPVAGAAPSAAPAASAGQVSVQSSKMGGKISRAEVMKRAAYWYKHRNDKSMYYGGKWHRDIDSKKHTYRQDCSGLVSMALHLKGSPNTELLGKRNANGKFVNSTYGYVISPSSMKPGDYTGFLGWGSGGSSGHVRLFIAWKNKKKGSYYAYDYGRKKLRKDTFNIHTDQKNGHKFGAYRYKKIS
ncbi:hypothetical protein AB0L00_10160 [Actinoallomurus sp. NPDC052308]|uniref:hypothetical protein n=1 Tax=Actinoallomurus sp. NPDC052308 TaxID=3155530 RepID=UPI003425C172